MTPRRSACLEYRHYGLLGAGVKGDPEGWPGAACLRRSASKRNILRDLAVAAFTSPALPAGRQEVGSGPPAVLPTLGQPGQGVAGPAPGTAPVVDSGAIGKAGAGALARSEGYHGLAATPPGVRILGMPVEPITTLVVDQHERTSPVLASLARYSWLSIRVSADRP